MNRAPFTWLPIDRVDAGISHRRRQNLQTPGQERPRAALSRQWAPSAPHHGENESFHPSANRPITEKRDQPATVWCRPLGARLPKGSPGPSMTDPHPATTPAPLGTRGPLTSSLRPCPPWLESGVRSGGGGRGAPHTGGLRPASAPPGLLLPNHPVPPGYDSVTPPRPVVARPHPVSDLGAPMTSLSALVRTRGRRSLSHPPRTR